LPVQAPLQLLQPQTQVVVLQVWLAVQRPLQLLHVSALQVQVLRSHLGVLPLQGGVQAVQTLSLQLQLV